MEAGNAAADVDPTKKKVVWKLRNALRTYMTILECPDTSNCPDALPDPLLSLDLGGSARRLINPPGSCQGWRHHIHAR